MNDIGPYVHFITTIERKLFKMLILLLIALVIAQCCMQIPSIRMLISPTYKLEGVPLEEDWLHDDLP